MNDQSNVIKPSHIAAARLKVAIADRKGEQVPDWIRQLASRDLSDLPSKPAAHVPDPTTVGLLGETESGTSTYVATALRDLGLATLREQAESGDVAAADLLLSSGDVAAELRTALRTLVDSDHAAAAEEVRGTITSPASGEASETVTFGLDGMSYEIDLSSNDASKMREELAPFVEHARKANSPPRRRRVDTGGDREQSARIREWAKARGFKVNERGRIPADIVSEHEATDQPAS